eukprot:180890_1
MAERLFVVMLEVFNDNIHFSCNINVVINNEAQFISNRNNFIYFTSIKLYNWWLPSIANNTNINVSKQSIKKIGGGQSIDDIDKIFIIKFRYKKNRTDENKFIKWCLYAFSL